VRPSPLVSNNGAQLDDLEDERTQYVFIDRDIVPLLSLPSYFAFISSSIFHVNHIPSILLSMHVPFL
jgi:hypothetical protein